MTGYKIIGLCCLLCHLSVSYAEDNVIQARLSSSKPIILGLNQSGIVKQVKVNIGDQVKTGQVLLKLDTHSTQAHKKATQAQLLAQVALLKEANNEWQRTEELHADALISQHEVDQVASRLAIAQANHAQAQASLAKAEKILRESQIIAPFDGIITARHIHPQLAVVNQLQMTPLLALNQAHHFQAITTISREQGQALGIGQQVTLIINQQSYQGWISGLDLQNQQNRYRLQLEINDPVLQVGMLVSIQLK